MSHRIYEAKQREIKKKSPFEAWPPLVLYLDLGEYLLGEYFLGEYLLVLFDGSDPGF